MARVAHKAKQEAERAENALHTATVELEAQRKEFETLSSGDSSYQRAIDAEAALTARSKELEEERARHSEDMGVVDKLRENIAELGRQLEAERKRAKSRAQEVNQEKTNEMENAKLRKLLTAAAEELRTTTKAKEDTAVAKRKVTSELGKEKETLLSQVEALTAEGQRLQREAKHQRLAAKALGMGYLVRQHTLRRQLQNAHLRQSELEVACDEARGERAAMGQENERLRHEADEALAAVAPLKAERQREHRELRNASVDDPARAMPRGLPRRKPLPEPLPHPSPLTRDPHPSLTPHPCPSPLTITLDVSLILRLISWPLKQCARPLLSPASPPTTVPNAGRRKPSSLTPHKIGWRRSRRVTANCVRPTATC